jgi:hypothetical protein
MALVHENYNEYSRKKRKHSFISYNAPDHNQQFDESIIENLKHTVENLQQQNNILLVKLDKLINSMNIIYTKSLNVSVSTQTDEIFYNYDYYA